MFLTFVWVLAFGLVALLWLMSATSSTEDKEKSLKFMQSFNPRIVDSYTTGEAYDYARRTTLSTLIYMVAVFISVMYILVI